MKKLNRNQIATIFIAIVCVFYLFVCFKGISLNREKDEALAKYHALNEQIHYFMQWEDEPHGELKIMRAWFYAAEADGVVLLETEEGELHEFENIEVNEGASYLMVFDGDEFVGLWEAV